MFYEITVKCERINERRKAKLVRELYLCDCLSFTEAEMAGLKVFSGYNTEGEVVAIKRSDILEIVNEFQQKKHYFKAKIVSTFIDDNCCKKESCYHVLFRADNISEANGLANEYMRQGLDDMKLDAIVKTKILDVLHE